MALENPPLNGKIMKNVHLFLELFPNYVVLLQKSHHVRERVVKVKLKVVKAKLRAMKEFEGDEGEIEGTK